MLKSITRSYSILLVLLLAGASDQAAAGPLYAVRPDGTMLYYNYAGEVDGSFRWSLEQKVIGSGWQDLRQLIAGDNGAIYAIRPNGEMLFYRYAGMSDGSFKWAVQNKVIGTGWQGFTSVFGGHNGAIYAIRPNGEMLFYRYAGMSDGAFKWAVEQKVIGSGWQDLTVFGGHNGAIYAIQPDGQMLFFRYAGMADGSFRWPVQHKVIGRGWNFQTVAAGGLSSPGAIIGVAVGGLAPSPPARRTSPWSQWARKDGVEYRYRWSWNPASSRYVDAIFEIHNPQNQTWHGDARSIECRIDTLSNFESVSLQPGQTREVTFKTLNCGTADNAFFRAGVSRSYSL